MIYCFLWANILHAWFGYWGRDQRLCPAGRSGASEESNKRRCRSEKTPNLVKIKGIDYANFTKLYDPKKRWEKGVNFQDLWCKVVLNWMFLHQLTPHLHLTLGVASTKPLQSPAPAKSVGAQGRRQHCSYTSSPRTPLLYLSSPARLSGQRGPLLLAYSHQ